LTGIFESRRFQLEAYFDSNRPKKSGKKFLFFVKQSVRLQCLNGAYLSEVDQELFVALFGEVTSLGQFTATAPQVTVATGVQLSSINARVGQKAFSDAVKELYHNECCFPSCSVTDPRFLIGSHIARWSDNEQLRGVLGNGLCLCLMHDKAFELGLFTLDERFRVFTNFKKAELTTAPAFCDLQAQHGKPIKLAAVRPLADALLEHWLRTGTDPIQADAEDAKGVSSD
jgi:hypothetical protein